VSVIISLFAMAGISTPMAMGPESAGNEREAKPSSLPFRDCDTDPKFAVVAATATAPTATASTATVASTTTVAQTTPAAPTTPASTTMTGESPMYCTHIQLVTGPIQRICQHTVSGVALNALSTTEYFEAIRVSRLFDADGKLTTDVGRAFMGPSCKTWFNYLEQQFLMKAFGDAVAGRRVYRPDMWYEYITTIYETMSSEPSMPLLMFLEKHRLFRIISVNGLTPAPPPASPY
jgi:hypothetical protein